MVFFWLAAIVVFVIAEAATVQLVSVWFAIGSLGGLIVAMLNGPVWLQATVFVLISAIILIFLRPIVKKLTGGKYSPTNADRLIGSVCRVTEKIDNVAAIGAVSAQGKTWSARSKTGVPIAEGSLVRILAINGVKLIVIPLEPSGQAEDIPNQ